MKQIGQFAKENDITIRAAHHYEKLGLIAPAKIDSITGYRYYNQEQSIVIKQILLLKNLGFSLSEIKLIIDSQMDRQYLYKLLIGKKNQALIDIETFQERNNLIENVLKIINKSSDKRINVEEIIKMKKDNIQGIELPENPFYNFAFKHYREAIKNEEEICILNLDMNRFKSINDKYGEKIGDEVLDRVRNTLINESIKIKPEVKKQHSMLTRTHGDEFQILLIDSLEIAEKLAKNIIASVASIDFNDISKDLKASCSIGIASTRNTGYNKGLRNLVHQAIDAMYKAKANKKKLHISE